MTEISGNHANPTLPLDAAATRIAEGGGLLACLRGRPKARRPRAGYCGRTSELSKPGAGPDETNQNQP